MDARAPAGSQSSAGAAVHPTDAVLDGGAGCAAFGPAGTVAVVVDDHDVAAALVPPAARPAAADPDPGGLTPIIGRRSGESVRVHPSPGTTVATANRAACAFRKGAGPQPPN